MKVNLDFVEKEARQKLQSETQKSHIVYPKLDCQAIINGYLVPGKTERGKVLGGVMDSNDSYVANSGWREGKDCCGYCVTSDHIVRRTGTALYIGYFHYVWGHVITDNLKKVWALCSEDIIRDVDSIVYITMDNRPLPGYVKELLNYAGVDFDKAEHITEPTMFDNVIVPDNSYLEVGVDRLATDEYIQTIRLIKDTVNVKISETPNLLKPIENILANNPINVYFTRTHLKGFRDIGEQRVERLIYKKGYIIIAPEEYSVLQQLYILMNCDELVTTEGSIAHNVVFCRPKTSVVILRKANYVNQHQLVINEVADIDVIYIDANCSCFAKGHEGIGPYYLCVTDGLKKYLHVDKSFGFPVILCPDFWLYGSYTLYRRMRVFAGMGYNKLSKFLKTNSI